MQKCYQQKYCLQCRDVTFHFRQMLLRLPGMWQNIWLIVLQVLLCSPWKISTLSFRYRQAIRNRIIQMKSKSNLERKLQNICLLFHLRKFHYCCAQHQHGQPWDGALGFMGEGWNPREGSMESLKKCSQADEHLLGWNILCIHPAAPGTHPAVHPWEDRWRSFLASQFTWAFLVQKHSTKRGGRGRQCAPPCKDRSQPRHSPRLRSQRELMGLLANPWL